MRHASRILRRAPCDVCFGRGRHTKRTGCSWGVHGHVWTSHKVHDLVGGLDSMLSRCCHVSIYVEPSFLDCLCEEAEGIVLASVGKLGAEDILKPPSLPPSLGIRLLREGVRRHYSERPVKHIVELLAFLLPLHASLPSPSIDTPGLGSPAPPRRGYLPRPDNAVAAPPRLLREKCF
jgi:hypothetical protein